MRGTGRSKCQARQRGFSLPEMLIVVAMIGIAVVVAVPLTRDTVQGARIRTSAEQFAADLRAARMIAVSNRSTVDVTVSAHPTNSYEYTDADGKLRHVDLPGGVQITSSTTPIRFQLNGSLTAPANTVFEIQLGKSTIERWTVASSILGVPSITRQRF